MIENEIENEKVAPEFQAQVEDLKPLEIPIGALNEDVVQSLIEEFILREGTDYGAQEISLESKVAQVFKQIQNQDVKIVFDPGLQSVTLMTKRDWIKLQGGIL